MSVGGRPSPGHLWLPVRRQIAITKTTKITKITAITVITHMIDQSINQSINQSITLSSTTHQPSHTRPLVPPSPALFISSSFSPALATCPPTRGAEFDALDPPLSCPLTHHPPSHHPSHPPPSLSHCLSPTIHPLTLSIIHPLTHPSHPPFLFRLFHFPLHLPLATCQRGRI